MFGRKERNPTGNIKISNPQKMESTQAMKISTTFHNGNTLEGIIYSPAFMFIYFYIKWQLCDAWNLGKDWFSL